VTGAGGGAGRAGPAAAGDGTVAGVDGCRTGWVVVRLGPAGLGVAVVPSIAPVIEEVAAGGLAAAAIDMPVGLPAAGPRACDAEARRLLGPRRASVFPAPARAVLGARTYREAAERSRAATGRSLPVQAYNLVPKVAELDRAMRPGLQDRVVEAHPELAFARLAGVPAAHPKRTPEGRAERLALLAAAGVGDLSRLRALGAAPDDILDAAVLALTAARARDGSAVRLGDGTVDARGLRMEVAY
jgi:predicted RNase H-like nuclease